MFLLNSSEFILAVARLFRKTCCEVLNAVSSSDSSVRLLMDFRLVSIGLGEAPGGGGIIAHTIQCSKGRSGFSEHDPFTILRPSSQVENVP